ncbi:DUF721 domain-containing protein [Bacteroidota bacterium]
MERSSEKKIGSILQVFLRSNNLKQGYLEYKITKAWSEVLGKQIDAATRSLFVKDRKLFVKLHSSVVRNELSMLKQDLIIRLNEHVGEVVIDDIVLR